MMTPRHQQIFITVGGISGRDPAHLTHAISGATTVHVRHTPGADVQSILVVSGDKTETLVHLRRQPQLAA